MPYCYVLLRGQGHVALVDVGYSHRDHGKHLAEKYNIENWRPPHVVLAECGVVPEDVDTVFITHAHFDHFGNIDDFPNATFYVQREEIERWTWVLSLPDRMRWMTASLDPASIIRAAELSALGRIKFIDGDVENVIPGVDLHLARDSHTYGSMWVSVCNDRAAAPKDIWVLAGDLVSQFDNLEMDGSLIDVPTMYNPGAQTVGSYTNIIVAMEEMMKLVDHDAKRIVPVHEERLAERFPSRLSKEDLRISEICLADGAKSFVI
ncbi:N-acyl homoserine lactonase family protein [Mesorhizobium sp. DCY119]|uniref:N-acyl homoserine lactonase family protein n=1 Tax=Mesorhizobium sp. DCY119 TaxID=2108445 RepID=UPI001FE030FD|nr:N-acyl homoserine lactonase family protein [Mesorhizobium sp. DCY119]